MNIKNRKPAVFLSEESTHLPRVGTAEGTVVSQAPPVA
jgi:hypothetical protein